ncbi:MAG: MFS transporter [Oscillospiraceae bacterium]|nr:MFS transporter [Oscillospiraceae bacterium]
MREQFRFLFSLRGNERTCVFADPLWNLPFTLYTPFLFYFMFTLGVDDIQIGIILTVGLVFQVVMALLGGVITDKFGRRKTTFIGGLVSWGIPCLIWAFSQNFWWFLIAQVINSVDAIVANSSECLWQDDAEDEDKTDKLINWLYILAMICSFFAPILGVFIGQYTVIPVMRVMFLISFVSMTAYFVIVFFFAAETTRGFERIEATRDIPIAAMLFGYKDVFLQVIRSPKMLRVTLLYALVGVTQLISGTFFALFATQSLGMPDYFLAYFPVFRSAVMLFSFFVIAHRLSVFSPRKVMFAGLAAYIAAHLLLLGSPPENMIWLSVYIVIEACAAALFLPRLDIMAIHSVRPKERMRIYSFFDVVALAIASPFGVLAGYLSNMDRRLPFILNVALFIGMLCFVAGGQKNIAKT